MIELDNVSFTYRGGESDAVPALTSIDLKLASGQFVAIIGQNGSGKSTLVKLLTAILYPTDGNIRIDGVPVDKEHRWDVRRRVSVVFQDPDDQLIMNRVIDDVAFGPENLGLARDEIGSRLIEDLSPGQKQRVAIAGALAMRPLFLILDEPTSLLPVPVAMRLISTVRDLSLRENMGVVHVTHSMYEAVLFERVVVRDEGGVLLDGSPAEVFKNVDRLREVGLDVPLAASLAHRLRARGIPIEEDILNTADLRASLSATVDTSPSG